MEYKVPVDGKWMQFDDAQLNELRAKGQGATADWLMGEFRDYQKNPLSRFLPHGVPWRSESKSYADGKVVIPEAGYPEAYGNDGVAFMNDWHSDYVMLKAARKTGKSFQGAAKIGNFMLNCDPAWLTYSGVGGWRTEHRPYNGPQIAIVSSFGPQNLEELWSAYLEIWPRDELGPYAPEYPIKELGEGELDNPDNPPIWGKPRHMSFGDSKPKKFIPYKSGGKLIFLLYTQMHHVWMNFRANAWHADEQPKIMHVHAFESGTQTMGDYTPIIFTFSGFKLKDRPDTGAAGPLKRVWDLRDMLGKKEEQIGRYSIDIPSVPDCIITPKKKAQQYDKFANPEIERDITTERLGLAVYYPGWEPGGGLAFGPDVWDRGLCVINPLWDVEQPAPRNWTKWRSLDYCDSRTTCCSWWGMGPIKTWWGEDMVIKVLYRLLYEQKLLAAPATQQIIHMSHNSRTHDYDERDDLTGNTYEYFTETQTGEQYYEDLIDCRIGAQKQQGQEIIDIFRRYGLNELGPASGKNNQNQIGALKDIMRIDYDRPHPFLKGKDGGKVNGCPGLFLFEGQCQAAIDEFETIPEDTSTEGTHVIDKKSPHDFIDTAKYWASSDPQYMGDWGVGDNGETQIDTTFSYWGR